MTEHMRYPKAVEKRLEMLMRRQQKLVAELQEILAAARSAVSKNRAEQRETMKEIHAIARGSW